MYHVKNITLMMSEIEDTDDNGLTVKEGWNNYIKDQLHN